MDEIKIDDYGTPPLRGMLLEAVKARIKNMYFNTPAIGTFRQIVQAVHLPAAVVEQFIKTNQRRSCLKPRHVEIAKELHMEGLSMEKIAVVLTEIEGFEITRYHLDEHEEFHHWKAQNRAKLPHHSNVESQQKQVKYVDGEIKICKKTPDGAIHQLGKMGIQTGKINYADQNRTQITKDVRNQIIGQLHDFGIKRKKIQQVLSQVTGQPFKSYDITNIIRSMKKGKPPTPQCKIECGVHVGEKEVILFKEMGSKGGWEEKTNWIAHINIYDGECTNYLGSHELIARDESYFDRIISSLYNIGLGSTRITTAINDLGKKCEISLIHSRVQILIKKGLLKSFPKGFFHNNNVKAINYHVEKDQIIIYRDPESTDKKRKQQDPWKVESNRIAALDLNTGDLTKYRDPLTGEAAPGDHKTSDTTGAMPVSKKSRSLFDLYVRYKWHADDELRGHNGLAKRCGVAPEQIQKIVLNNPWGVLKPAHDYLLLKMHEAGVGKNEIRRALTELEGIPLSLSIITRKAEKFAATHPPKNGAPRYVKVTGDSLEMYDDETGKIVDKISFKDADDAAREGFSVPSLNRPPTRKQGLALVGLAALTKNNLDELTKETRIKGTRLAKAILLYDLFDGDEAKFNARFRTTLDPAMIDKIVTFTKFSDLSLKKIAAKCKCHATTAGRYALRLAFLGIQQLYDARFNPTAASDAQIRQILALATDKAHAYSITEIAALTHMNYNVVRNTVCEGVFHNDETAFAEVYPFFSLSKNQVEAVKAAILTGSESAIVTAKQCGVAEFTVRRIALVEVYHGNYDRYRARFPESKLDDATRAEAVNLILDARPGALNLQEITVKLNTDGHPVSLGAVYSLAKEIMPDPEERARRFPGDQTKALGRATHVLCEGICKSALQARGTEWFSEVWWVTPDPARWQHVHVDGVVRLPHAVMRQWFDWVGDAGVPLWEELGLSRQVIEHAEEVDFDFTGSLFNIAAQEKVDKYACSAPKTPHRKRIVFIVNTGQWFWEGRVKGPPGCEENARIITTDLLADLCQLDPATRQRLKEVTRNYQCGEREAQETLAAKWGMRAENDTARYYERQGMEVPDFARAARGGYQDLREYLKSDATPKTKHEEPQKRIITFPPASFKPRDIDNCELPQQPPKIAAIGVINEISSPLLKGDGGGTGRLAAILNRLPELVKYKHEQKVEEIHVDGMQDASNTQDRGSKGPDCRRTR